MAKQRHADGARLARSLRWTMVALGIAAIACRDVELPTQARDLRIGAPSPSLAGESGAASRQIDGQYIITFDDSVSDVPGYAKRMAAQYGEDPLFIYSDAIKGFAARLPDQAVAALERNPRVAAIEPDEIVTLASVETPVPSWGLDRIDQRSRPLDSSYEYASDGAGVNVYIIDSGIRGTHTEFGGRAVGAFTTVSDGRGTSDCTGHGTHVAGIIGGRTFGVAKGVTLNALRVYDCSARSTVSAVISAVDWVTKNRVLPAVANMSMASTLSSSLNAAVKASIDAGVTYVVAAANYSADACAYSPASVSQAITVAATNSLDGQAAYSNFGSCVDLYAPGSSILSTWYTSDTATFYSSGTSMAAPHAAGAAALYLASNPGAVPASVAQALVANATPNVVTGAGVGSPNLLLYTGFIGTPVSSPPPADTSSAPPAPAPPPAPPVASFTVGCSRSACTVDASGSTSGSGITSYAWSFGDASQSVASSGPRSSHSYASTGSFSIVLEVTDSVGASARASHTVRIRKL
jgi:subtilisin family serine protease